LEDCPNVKLIFCR